jgi:hypothetical protein
MNISTQDLGCFKRAGRAPTPTGTRASWTSTSRCALDVTARLTSKILSIAVSSEVLTDEA